MECLLLLLQMAVQQSPLLPQLEAHAQCLGVGGLVCTRISTVAFAVYAMCDIGNVLNTGKSGAQGCCTACASAANY